MLVEGDAESGGKRKNKAKDVGGLEDLVRELDPLKAVPGLYYRSICQPGPVVSVSSSKDVNLHSPEKYVLFSFETDVVGGDDLEVALRPGPVIDEIVGRHDASVGLLLK